MRGEEGMKNWSSRFNRVVMGIWLVRPMGMHICEKQVRAGQMWSRGSKARHMRMLRGRWWMKRYEYSSITDSEDSYNTKKVCQTLLANSMIIYR